ARIRHGWDIGQSVDTFCGGHCQRTNPTNFDVLDRPSAADVHLYLPADKVHQSRRVASIRHVQHIDIGHHFEKLNGGLDGAAGRSSSHLAGMGLCISDEFGDRLGRNRWIDHHYIRRAREARDWGDITEKYEAEFFVERRIDRVRGDDEKEGVAIRRCLRDYLGSDIARGTRSVLNYEIAGRVAPKAVAPPCAR